MNYNKIIIRPILTEKSNSLREKENVYAFEVDRRANKPLIKEAIESLFDVHVIDCRIVNKKGKKRRMGRFNPGFTKNRKKAYIKLKSGETFDFFEGISS